MPTMKRRNETTGLVHPLLAWLSLRGFTVLKPGFGPYEALKIVSQRGQIVRGIVWRNNTGAFASEYKGRRSFVRLGITGQSDICGMLKDGRWLCIECKLLTMKVTADQQAWLELVKQCGGVAILARSIDDVQRELLREGVLA